MWDQPSLTHSFWLKFLHFVCCFCDASSKTWLTNVLEISTFGFLSGFFLFLCLGGCWCRDLPQYGHKQWQSYFGRTFDVYTKLWKFQQQHRSVQYNIKNPTSAWIQTPPLGTSCLLTGRSWTLDMGWSGGRLGKWPPKLDNFITTTSE